MWLEFWIAVLAGALFLYLPGCLVGRGFGLSKTAAFAGAPIISLLLYCLLAISYDFAGIWTTGWNLFIPVLVVGAVCYIAGCFVRRPRGKHNVKKRFDKGSFLSSPYLFIALYALVGVLGAIYVFTSNLSTPDCSTLAYDDKTHVAVVRSFLETGNYSSLSTDYEYDLHDGGGSYYPAGWHLLSASIASICNSSVFTGMNAALFLCCAFIYPVGCFYLVSRLFKNDKIMLVIGAFLTIVFVAFPWHFLTYGRLVSNLIAFTFVPTMLACIIDLFAEGTSRVDRMRVFALAFAGCCLTVFTQPNAFFTLVVFSYPYLAYRLWRYPLKRHHKNPVRVRVLLVAAFTLFVVAFLVACYASPIFYSVTRFKWPAPISMVQAVLNLVLQGTSVLVKTAYGPYSPLLGILVLGGAVYAAAKRKDMRWVVAAFLIVSVMYLIDCGTNSRIKNYMTGFWYTDQHRVSAMVAMISYPLAVFGLGSICEFVMHRIRSRAASVVSAVLMVSVSMVVMMFPSVALSDGPAVSTAFGLQRLEVKTMYSAEMSDSEVILSAAEWEFSDKVAEITGDDLVFNIPMDGSMFSYQFSGVRTFYRYHFDLLDTETYPRILQRGLDDIASDPTVRRAADALGIKYVMMLDQGHEPFHLNWGDYHPASWVGVTNINENTPGFEQVLSEGDMKLYRILSEEELEASQEQ